MRSMTTNALARRMNELVELARGAGMDFSQAHLFACMWLLAPNLAKRGIVPGFRTMNDFLSSSSWRQLDHFLGGAAALSLFSDNALESLLRNAFTGADTNSQTETLDVIEVADLSWSVFGQNRSLSSGTPALHPELCDLLIDTLDPDAASHVWVPFDATGQLIFRAARRGATVWAARGPSHSVALIKLILVAVAPEAWAQRVRLETVEHLSESAGYTGFTHGLVTAPMGATLPAGAWSDFERVRRVREFQPVPSELDRSDARAIATFWPVISSVAVFMVSPSVLFAKGQESRLRRALLTSGPGNAVAGVLGLPGGLLSHTNLAPGVLLLGENVDRVGTRLVDVAGKLVDGQYVNRFGKDMDLPRVQQLLAADHPVPDLAVLVAPQECRQNDYSLLPARYTRRVAGYGDHRVPLGQLLMGNELRATPPGHDPDALTVWEVGPTLLDRWQPIRLVPDKVVRISQKRLKHAGLRANDIIVAVKGSVGKVGLMGEIFTQPAAVASTLIDEGAEPFTVTPEAVPAQSCVGLRPDTTKVLPEYLFTFMKSEDFAAQLEALRVGAALPHVTPSTLLASIQVPLPSLEEQAKLVERYWEIRDLEARIERLQGELDSARRGLFSIKS